MDIIKIESDNIDILYNKIDRYIKKINITAKINIEEELTINKNNTNRFIYRDYINASNYFINNNPSQLSLISIINPFNTDDNIYWNMIQDDIYLSYKIIIELTIYKNQNIFKIIKKSKYYDYEEDYLVHYL